MSEKLKPCPFCESKYIGVIIPIEKEYQVQCGDCYASSSIESTEKKAIKAWNRRAATVVNEPLTLEELSEMMATHEYGDGWLAYRRPPEGGEG